jgi:glycosyltransferase involved in cell wall biosynthesis
MKVAIVHDYFIQNGGAEKVVESLLKIYPQADIYTSVFCPDNLKDNPLTLDIYQAGRVSTSIMQKLMISQDKPTWALKYSKHLYFAYPTAMSLMHVNGYDKVIISSTYCAKNVRLSDNKQVIHYCHSPTRFLHGLVTEKDHSSLPLWQKVVSKVFFEPVLRFQDLRAVKYLVSHNTIWIGNSNFIKDKIREVYHISADVIYPPVDIDKFSTVVRNPNPTEDYYLCHGRISFHKRLDLAIQACVKMNRKLKISGISVLQEDIKYLKSLVPSGSEHLIEFLGRTTDKQLRELVANAKAMIFPGQEDAGISPIEMMSGSLPIIAYQSGGALEYVQDGINGVFFKIQDVNCLVEAIQEFEAMSWDTEVIKSSVKKFSEEYFLEAFGNIR